VTKPFASNVWITREMVGLLTSNSSTRCSYLSSSP
jgi:hypothetical protein